MNLKIKINKKKKNIYIMSEPKIFLLLPSENNIDYVNPRNQIYEYWCVKCSKELIINDPNIFFCPYCGIERYKIKKNKI